MTVERPVKVRAANYLLLASALATEVASATGCLPRPTPISPEPTAAKPEPTEPKLAVPTQPGLEESGFEFPGSFAMDTDLEAKLFPSANGEETVYLDYGDDARDNSLAAVGAEIEKGGEWVRKGYPSREPFCFPNERGQMFCAARQTRDGCYGDGLAMALQLELAEDGISYFINPFLLVDLYLRTNPEGVEELTVIRRDVQAEEPIGTPTARLKAANILMQGWGFKTFMEELGVKIHPITYTPNFFFKENGDILLASGTARHLGFGTSIAAPGTESPQPAQNEIVNALANEIAQIISQSKQAGNQVLMTVKLGPNNNHCILVLNIEKEGNQVALRAVEGLGANPRIVSSFNKMGFLLKDDGTTIYLSLNEIIRRGGFQQIEEIKVEEPGKLIELLQLGNQTQVGS